MAWTSGVMVDRADGYVVGSTVWNQLFGATGNLQHLYDSRLLKRKSGTEVFTTNTTFATLAASSGNFEFTIAASEIWVVRMVIPVSFGGTGGVKLQLTGPAAPTLVRVDAYSTYYEASADIGLFNHTAATAFSSSFIAINSSGGAGGIPTPAVIFCDALIVNGANAGTVALQGAQNSSNSTTTFAAGMWWAPRRIG